MTIFSSCVSKYTKPSSCANSPNAKTYQIMKWLKTSKCISSLTSLVHTRPTYNRSMKVVTRQHHELFIAVVSNHFNSLAIHFMHELVWDTQNKCRSIRMHYGSFLTVLLSPHSTHITRKYESGYMASSRTICCCGLYSHHVYRWLNHRWFEMSGNTKICKGSERIEKENRKEHLDAAWFHVQTSTLLVSVGYSLFISSKHWHSRGHTLYVHVEKVTFPWFPFFLIFSIELNRDVDNFIYWWCIHSWI